MSDKKQNRNASPPGGDRPLRRPAAKSGAPGKFKGKSPGRAFEEARDAPRGKSPARVGGGKSVDKSAREKPEGQKPFAGRSGAARGKPAVARHARLPAAEPAQDKAFAGDRIAKVMARAGVCSRRDAENWIAEGRVAVNGRVLASPAVNVAENDRIEIDGKPMQARERTRLFLFHKPVGLVTSARDPEGRETVFSYLDAQRPELPRLVSVGRLDINTEGLLLLTNDGGLARTLELPATGWTRRYRVRAHGVIDQARLDALKKGVVVEGVVYAPIEALLERVQGANAWIAMSLTEGKNREIKRVLAHLGLEVTRLIRVSYGPFQLGDLPEGGVEEVRLKVLREQLGKNLAELAGVDFSAPARELSAAEREEVRQRAEKRPRKHVTVLRQQRAEQAATGPRARIARGATADRKGRAVVVERVTPTRPRASEEAPTSRNARRFEAMRSGERPPRRERSSREETVETRQQRRPRTDASTDTRRDMRREATAREWEGPARDGRAADKSPRAGRPPDRTEARQIERVAARFAERQEGRRASAAPGGGRRGTDSFQPREPRRDNTGARWRDSRGAEDNGRNARPRSDFGAQTQERTSTGSSRSDRKPGGKFGGKPGGKFGGKFGGKPGARSGDSPGKGPRGDRPPRRPRGA